MTTPIHFFHANGFPSETYKDLLSNIEGDILSPISILGKNISSVEEGYSDFVDEVIEHASVTQGEGIAIPSPCVTEACSITSSTKSL